MEATRYPEGFTGADLRRQLRIKETPVQKHDRRKHNKARRKELGMICVRGAIQGSKNVSQGMETGAIARTQTRAAKGNG